jgi:hypothetical protein
MLFDYRDIICRHRYHSIYGCVYEHLTYTDLCGKEPGTTEDSRRRLFSIQSPIIGEMTLARAPELVPLSGPLLPLVRVAVTLLREISIAILWNEKSKYIYKHSHILTSTDGSQLTWVVHSATICISQFLCMLDLFSSPTIHHTFTIPYVSVSVVPHSSLTVFPFHLQYIHAYSILWSTSSLSFLSHACLHEQHLSRWCSQLISQKPSSCETADKLFPPSYLHISLYFHV